MTFDRRTLLQAGLQAGLATGIAAAAAPAVAAPAKRSQPAVAETARPGGLGLEPGSGADQSARLQALIDAAALRGETLILPPGRFRASGLILRPGTRIVGSGSATVLVLADTRSLIAARDADGALLADLALDGASLPLAGGAEAALVAIADSRRMVIENVDISAVGGHALRLERVGGRVSGCRVSHASETGIRAIDATGLQITGNALSDCGNNGIQVWRSASGEDGTLVTGNRITRIRADGGGSGQNGNGINLFRAAGVSVAGNRITDCAYSAIRANAASNVEIVANSVARIGEVAIYAEFDFQGAIIAQNLVDTAATGISVTNFDAGGRLAVIQGNLVRNLVRREAEAIDKRGEGIAVEADAAVTGNTIEGAATVGLMIGWGPHMRDVVASGNLIRGAPLGILVTADPEAGSCLVAGNMISGATGGAIRAMRHGVPFGPDLAREEAASRRVVIRDNMAV